MNHEELIEAWKHEEQQPFTGWNFSYLNDRMVAELPPWSYPEQAAELMRQSSAVLDMGTGAANGYWNCGRTDQRKWWSPKTIYPM